MSRRGSVLLHVLVTGVIASIIAAGLLKMAMLRYTAAARASSGAQARKQADALLNTAISYWNSSNIVCSDIPGVGCNQTYATSPGTCACGCPASGLPAITVTGGGAPPCTISVESAEPSQ